MTPREYYSFFVVILAALLPFVNGHIEFWDDPEAFFVWVPPRRNSDFFYHKTGRENMGFAFAGSAEFPWIVDIRGTHYDQNIWTTGNLITAYDVITTCRAALQMSLIIADSPEDAVQFSKRQELKFEPLPGLKVNFASNYLWEDYTDGLTDEKVAIKVDNNPFASQFHYSGSRLIKGIFLNADCRKSLGELGQFRFDNGGFRLQNPLYAAPPKIHFMPVPIEYTRETKGFNWKWGDQVIDFHIEKRLMCYVASFGRNFRNWEDNYMVDFKVRYRVYHNDWKRCFDTDQLAYYECPETKSDRCELLAKPAPELMCFAPRAHVGTVCQHDRGAPIVCDRRVYGFVTLAVNYNYCNNLIQLPFVVLRLSAIGDIYSDLQEPKFDIPFQYTYPMKKGHLPYGGAKQLYSKSLILRNLFMMLIIYQQ